MTVKNFIATGMIAATLIAGIPVVEGATNTSVISTTASAATSYGSLSMAKIQEYERMWESYDYVLKRGFYPTSSTREMNRAMQVMLNDVMGTSLDEDGYIGPASEKVMRQYQSTRGLEVDGKFGRLSMSKLIAECKALAGSNGEYALHLSFNQAYRYAKAYWNTRNSQYNYYSGRNCANFCSQIMVNAGVPTTSEFKNGSYAFVNVDGLMSYFKSAYGVSYVSGTPKAGSVKPGDIIYTNNGSHVMFVMEVSSNGSIRASGNTNNRDCLSVSRSCISGVLKTSALFA